MRPRILLIEDNAANLELMCYLLEAYGYPPLTARDGEAGLAIARDERPDLVICDIQLPKMSGFEVARRLKGDEELRLLPIVAVTAFAMVGDRDRVLAAGFDGYITKPIEPETFVGQVKAFLKSEDQTPPLLSNAPTTGGDVLPATGRQRILVVDNTPVNLALKRSLLEPLGYLVSTAGGMGEALVSVRRSHPDLIISDVHMADGSGYDFIRSLKADPILRSIPVMFLTSTSCDEASRALGLSLGAARFLFRPIEPLALLAEIEGCLHEQVVS